MKRQAIIYLLKLCGEAVAFTIFAGIVIGIIGNLKQWDTSIKYSNAFFIAACLMIIGGLSSRLGAGQEWSYFQGVHTESIGDKSPGERANFIVEASSSYRLVILGLLSGILLMLLSWFVTELF